MEHRIEPAMEHGNWNMQWNMEIGTCNGVEWNMQWNGTCFIFYKSLKTVLFPAAVCVQIATEIWNRPMEHMLIETDVSFLQKQQETTGVNIF